MVSMKLGSKLESFQLDGQTWICTSGLPCDVIIEVGEISFHLHKFPLISRSGLLENMIGESSGDENKIHTLQLHDIPGGSDTFLLVAKFCYGIIFELTPSNVVTLRCASEYLHMNDDYGPLNLIGQTETFLNEVFTTWGHTIKALKTCDEILPNADGLHVVKRCINSLATKACADTCLWPVQAAEDNTVIWNGIKTEDNLFLGSEGWWYEDVSTLRLPLYKSFILEVEARNIGADKIMGSVIFYAERNLPLLGRHNKRPVSCSSTEMDQRKLLEEIVGLLPYKKGVAPTNFFLRLLRTSTVLHAIQSCRDSLEKRVGAQLDEVALEDLLIPNMGYSSETLYDIDCVQRIFEHFLAFYTENCIVEESGELLEGGIDSLTPMAVVANLVDGYLAEVAPDSNLKLTKFVSFASGVPEYARPLDDGIYRAIDIFLKAHPWLTDSEKEQVCQLMNCQKLSLEASTHAAQNERLPLRIIVQVLFFEQLRLRTSVSSWFFVSENLDSSNNNRGGQELALAQSSGEIPLQERSVCADKIRERVVELEKECVSMKQELAKMVGTKGGWNPFGKRFAFRACDPKKSSNVAENFKASRRSAGRRS